MKTLKKSSLKIIYSNRPLILAGLVAIFACSTPTPLFAWDWPWHSEDLQAQVEAAHEAQIICQHNADNAYRTAENARQHARTVTGISLLAGLCSACVIAYLCKHRVVNRPIVKKEVVQNVIRQEVIVRSPAHDVVTDMVVIDGLNVIYGSCSNPRPVLNNLIGLLLVLQKQHCKFKCFFDPETFFVLVKVGQRSDAYAYRRLCYDFPDLFIEVPVANEADAYVLAYAHKHGTPIISNDRYRDYDEKYPWLKSEPQRRTPFLVDSGVMQILPLGIEAAIPTDLKAAEASLRACLGKPAPVIPAAKSTPTNNHLPINGEVLAAA